MKRLWLWHAPQGKIDVIINVISTGVRMFLVLMAIVFVAVSSNVGAQAGGPVGALWFFVVAMALFGLWNVWDIIKSWGWVPAARLVIGKSEIAFETPLLRRLLSNTTLSRGKPIELSVREHGVLRAVKTIHVYEFRQGDVKTRYLAPMYITEASEKELKRALAKAQTPLKAPHIPR